MSIDAGLPDYDGVHKLVNDAAIINQDAENEGWIFKMKISDSNQYSELMSEDEYKQFLEQ